MLQSIEEFGCTIVPSLKLVLPNVKLMTTPSIPTDYGPRDPTVSLKYLVKPPRTWAEFVKANDWSGVLN